MTVMVDWPYNTRFLLTYCCFDQTMKDDKDAESTHSHNMLTYISHDGLSVRTDF